MLKPRNQPSAIAISTCGVTVLCVQSRLSKLLLARNGWRCPGQHSMHSGSATKCRRDSERGTLKRPPNLDYLLRRLLLVAAESGGIHTDIDERERDSLVPLIVPGPVALMVFPIWSDRCRCRSRCRVFGKTIDELRLVLLPRNGKSFHT